MEAVWEWKKLGRTFLGGGSPLMEAVGADVERVDGHVRGYNPFESTCLGYGQDWHF